ncbi:ATP-binding protein [Limnospira platensis CENA597]|uniref:ATP-binding protein n=1 Tax=Limnospira platensis TaxID=118562 RepID=UPI003D9FEC92
MIASGFRFHLALFRLEKAILDTSPIIVGPETKIMDAIALMKESDAQVVLVVNDSTPIGSFSAKEVVDVVSKKIDIHETKVGEVMGELPLVLKKSQLPNISSLIALFNNAETDFGVVVNDDNQLVGLISTSRLLKILNNPILYQSVSQLQEQIDSLRSENHDLRDYSQKQIDQIQAEFQDLKTSLITTISHELRTPLTTISFSAGLLESYSQRISDDKKRTHFQRIRVGIQQMTELLNDILIIEKAESGKLIPHPVLVNLKEFCANLIAEIQLTTDKHNLIFTCPSSFPDTRLDEYLISQILTNLISNAIKYSQAGGDIKIDLTCEDDRVILAIKDSGIGIPKLDIKRLFEPFHRGINVGNISGTGLGLSLVKKAVDLQLGEIRVESEEGIGTTCTVILPSKLEE